MAFPCFIQHSCPLRRYYRCLGDMATGQVGSKIWNALNFSRVVSESINGEVQSSMIVRIILSRVIWYFRANVLSYWLMGRLGLIGVTRFYVDQRCKNVRSTRILEAYKPFRLRLPICSVVRTHAWHSNSVMHSFNKHPSFQMSPRIFTIAENPVDYQHRSFGSTCHPKIYNVRQHQGPFTPKTSSFIANVNVSFDKPATR